MSNDGVAMVLRTARHEDARDIARIWYHGWCDGHLGHVPDELVAVRTRVSFDLRAAQRIGDTVVATVDGAVAGFVMVVDDEVEQVYVSASHRGTGVAAVLLAEAERLVAVNGHQRGWLAVVAGNTRARRFYERTDGPTRAHSTISQRAPPVLSRFPPTAIRSRSQSACNGHAACHRAPADGARSTCKGRRGAPQMGTENR